MFGLPSITSDTALFLDFDGTLADLAADPGAVRVEHGLVSTLTILYEKLEGAVAIVSGRRASDIDMLLAPLRLPAAFEHGSQWRGVNASVVSLVTPDLTEVLRAARAFTENRPGLLLEPKTTSVALHFRHAPDSEAACREMMTGLVRQHPGLELIAGKFVFEAKPTGLDKGHAIDLFMEAPPFANRRPLFAGDDVTDEAGFASVQRRGGHGIKVGPGGSLAACRCDSPQALRAWLHFSARRLGAPLAAGRHA